MRAKSHVRPDSDTVSDRPAPQRTRVEIDNLSKFFVRAGGDEVRAVDDVSLTVNDDEIVVLLGPSGCGKSTLLRCIAGLEEPSDGTIRIADTVVFSSDERVLVPPNERDVNMMFQSYALWPHMTLEANVAYPLQVAGSRKREATLRAREYLELVGLGGLGRQYAAGVSGGQAQRAALARTLIKEPAVVLFDEPLSNVDAQVRSRLRGELLRIHRELGFSAVYVTHDQIEALGVATRIAVMRQGKIEQVGTPVEIYDTPSNTYVAGFVGVANLLEGTVKERQRGLIECETQIGRLSVTANGDDLPDSPRAAVGDEVVLLIRPEFWAMRRDNGSVGTQRANTFNATVVSAIYAGSRTEYVCKVGSTEVDVWVTAELEPISIGEHVLLSVDPSSARMIGSEGLTEGKYGSQEFRRE